MKKSFSVLLTLLLYFSLQGYAQEQKSIKFESNHNYLGGFKSDHGIIESTFVFENIETKNVKIEKITSSSGCKIINYTNGIIAPNKKGYITVSYNSHSRIGKFTESIFVKTDQKGEDVYELSISGEIISKDKTLADNYLYSSGNLKFLSKFLVYKNIYNTEIRKETMRIYNNWDKIMKLDNFDTLRHIICEIKPKELDPGQEGSIFITYNAAKKYDYGVVTDTLTLVTNDEKQPNKELYIKADIFEDFSKLKESKRKIAPKISFTNTNFDFGLVKEGEVIIYVFEIKNKGIRELVVRKMDPGSSISIHPQRLKVRQQKTSKITVAINTMGYKGKFKETITVISNDPKIPRMKLYIQGEVN